MIVWTYLTQCVPLVKMNPALHENTGLIFHVAKDQTPLMTGNYKGTHMCKHTHTHPHTCTRTRTHTNTHTHTHTVKLICIKNGSQQLKKRPTEVCSCSCATLIP